MDKFGIDSKYENWIIVGGPYKKYDEIEYYPFSNKKDAYEKLYNLLHISGEHELDMCIKDDGYFGLDENDNPSEYVIGKVRDHTIIMFNSEDEYNMYEMELPLNKFNSVLYYMESLNEDSTFISFHLTKKDAEDSIEIEKKVMLIWVMMMMNFIKLEN